MNRAGEVILGTLIFFLGVAPEQAQEHAGLLIAIGAGAVVLEVCDQLSKHIMKKVKEMEGK
jgi:hypothetical protein